MACRRRARLRVFPSLFPPFPFFCSAHCRLPVRTAVDPHTYKKEPSLAPEKPGNQRPQFLVFSARACPFFLPFSLFLADPPTTIRARVLSSVSPVSRLHALFPCPSISSPQTLQVCDPLSVAFRSPPCIFSFKIFLRILHPKRLRTLASPPQRQLHLGFSRSPSPPRGFAFPSGRGFVIFLLRTHG